MLMAWANNITQKVMQAARALLASSGVAGIPASSIYCGIDDEQLANPRVVCLCSEANVTAAPFSGNWTCKLDILVRTNADDTSPDSHFDVAGDVFSKFFSTTTASDLSGALSDFHVFLVVPQRQTYGREDRSWVSIITLTIECCGMDITES